MAISQLPDDAFVETFEIPAARIVGGSPFPLGVKARKSAEIVNIDLAVKELESLAAAGELARLLSINGAILFRDFPVKDANDFAKFTKAFGLPQPHHEVGLAGIRTKVNDLVKTANEEPSDVKFYYHSEYGRSAHFPGVLFFYSQKVPQSGGQTPLLSSLEMWERIEQELPEFAKDVSQKEIIGRQYYPSKDDPEAADIGWNWQDSYGFEIRPEDSLETQHAKVEKIIDQLSAKAEWQENGALHVVQKLPAVRRVTSTGKASFFNGLMGVHGRSRDNKATQPPHKGLDGKYHLPSTYGDGTPIPPHYLDRVLEIAEEIGFLTPWKEGDIALIDNYTVQHARTPWIGERSLLVSLWDGHETFSPF